MGGGNAQLLDGCRHAGNRIGFFIDVLRNLIGRNRKGTRHVTHLHRLFFNIPYHVAQAFLHHFHGVQKTDGISLWHLHVNREIAQ